MECNKDEAARAKELAEKKFREKDIKGAKTLALKAQALFPSLGGIPDLLATLNVYLSAERKISGDVDWYGVLGIDPSSDDETLKKQYRKLALILHPDKNKSVGAEGAFKILSEAWSLLSDKARRVAYDQKRSSRGIYQKVMPSNQSKPNGLRPSASIGNLNNKTRNYPNPHSNPVAAPHRNTFWTVCTRCEMQFEYAVLYLNRKLECYNCKKPFVAIQISPPQKTVQPSWSSHMPYSTSTGARTFASNPSTVPAGHPGDVGNVPASASLASKTKNSVQLPCEDTKIMHEDAKVSATLEDAIKSKTAALKRTKAGNADVPSSATRVEKPKKRRRTNELKMNGSKTETTDQMALGSRTAHPGSLNGVQRRIANTRELSLFEIRNMLMGKAKTEIFKKLNEWKNMTPAPKASSKDTQVKETEKIPNADVKRANHVGSKPNIRGEEEHQEQNLKTSLPVTSGDSETQPCDSAPLSMDVPDPDFHDFDKDRTENAFGDNQIWAAYDDEDGMPRYYAMIHQVISRKPFKMRISWLNSKSNAEFGALNWVGCGFYKTCGHFRVGQYKMNDSVNSFSHTVKWRKGTRGAIQIYPSKTDVWALYRNWSPEWNEHTPDEVIHKYDMVEVLDDYDEDKGVTVISLVKVTGFKTVFCRHMDEKQARVIPREEMFRFSHQVPSLLLTAQESPNAPIGCLELDPAATPMELLEVITESPTASKD